MRPLPAMGKGLATVVIFGAVWFTATALLRPDPRPLPDLPQLARLSGAPLMPENLAGRPFVVNLWATWCPPCRRELPMLADVRSEEHTSELQSLMRISYAVFCLKKKK